MRIFFSTLLCLLLSLPSAFADDPAPRLTVGVVAPLTGAIANVGESLRNMVVLASDADPDARLVHFIFEDDGFQPPKTVAAVRKLISEDRVDGLILFGSGTSLSAAPVAEQQRIPTIAIAMADSVVQNRRFIFRLYVSIEQQSEAIAAEVRRKAYQSVAIVSTQQEAMLKFRDIFVEHRPAPIGIDEQVPPGSTELRTIAAKIAAAGPDAVYLSMLPPELSILPLQLRQLGYRGEFFGSAQLQNQAAVKAASGALEGAWFTTADDTGAAAVFERYKNRFGEMPVPEGLNAYDAARLFIHAAKSESVAGVLANPQGFVGALGKYTLVPPNTYVLPVALKRVSGDHFQMFRSGG